MIRLEIHMKNQEVHSITLPYEGDEIESAMQRFRNTGGEFMNEERSYVTFSGFSSVKPHIFVSRPSEISCLKFYQE